MRCRDERAALTPKTRGFMGRAEFAALRPGAIVVITGRGATIDTEALLEALRCGHLRAALLDVTDRSRCRRPPLWSIENVFITPHYSGSHFAYNQRADKIFLDNLRRYLANEPLTNVVDKHESIEQQNAEKFAEAYYPILSCTV